MSSSIHSGKKTSVLSRPEKLDGGIVEDIKTATLDEIEAMHERGELYFNPDAPDGEELGEEFWANAVVLQPLRSKSVHLKLDPEVFEYFVQITNGKGHLTRMQAVLKAYMVAHKATVPPTAE
jgi:uncharacterized protein (DUF4415 family)